MLATNYRNDFLTSSSATNLYSVPSEPSFYENFCDVICHLLDRIQLGYKLITRGKNKTISNIFRKYSNTEKGKYTYMHFLSPDDINKYLCPSVNREDVPLGRFNLLHFKSLQRKLQF